LELGLLQLKL